MAKTDSPLEKVEMNERKQTAGSKSRMVVKPTAKAGSTPSKKIRPQRG